MKWFWALPLLAIASVSGCDPGGSSDQSDGITLGVVMSTFSSPYNSAIVREFKRYTEEQGYQLVMLDSMLDIQREAYNIDNLISKRVDAILVNAVDSKGSRAALRKAAQAGYMVLCFNATVDAASELGVRAYTGPKYYDQGAMAAKVVLQQLQEQSHAVMITGTPGYSAANDRETGFLDTIQQEKALLTMLDIQTANWMREDAQRIMSDFITKYDDEIDVVYIHDDNMAAGAVNAFKAAGYTLDNKPLIVSIGAMADGLPLIQQGWLDSSIMQSPLEDCQLAIETAVAIMAGQQTESFQNYFMQTPPVDQSNVAEVIALDMWR